MSQERSNRSKPPRRDWEAEVDRQIREAMERGDFDHLAGKGEPLNLDENPFVPADWRIAFKMLREAGMAPDWIELDKEIRSESHTLSVWLEQQVQWHRRRKAQWKTLSLYQMIAEREQLTQMRDQVCVLYRERAMALNQMIDLFNLKAPRSVTHHLRVQIEEEIRGFREACAK